MRAEHIAGAVDNLTGLVAQFVGDPVLGVALWDEADVVAVRFIGNR